MEIAYYPNSLSESNVIILEENHIRAPRAYLIMFILQQFQKTSIIIEF